MEPGYGSVQVGRSIPPLFPPASGHLRIDLIGRRVRNEHSGFTANRPASAENGTIESRVTRFLGMGGYEIDRHFCQSVEHSLLNQRVRLQGMDSIERPTTCNFGREAVRLARPIPWTLTTLTELHETTLYGTKLSIQ